MLESGKGRSILCQEWDVSGRVWAPWVVRAPNRRLPVLVGRFEGRVDGVESVLVQWVRHISRVAVRGRQDGDSSQRNDLSRRDAVGSPIPVGCAQVLSCRYPALLILVSLGNRKSILLQRLLYYSISIVVM